MPWAQGGLNQRGYNSGVDELLDGRFFYIWYMAVKGFYGEKIVDKHYHKGEQVYWDKFSSIHNKWFKFSGLVPQTVENYKGVRTAIVYSTRRNWLDWVTE